MTTQKDPREMKTGELAEEARRAGVKNVEQMNKSELLDTISKGKQQQAKSGQGRSR